MHNIWIQRAKCEMWNVKIWFRIFVYYVRVQTGKYAWNLFARAIIYLFFSRNYLWFRSLLSLFSGRSFKAANKSRNLGNKVDLTTANSAGRNESDPSYWEAVMNGSCWKLNNLERQQREKVRSRKPLIVDD